MKRKINSLEDLDREMKKLEMEMDYTARSFKRSLKMTKRKATSMTTLKGIAPIAIEKAVKYGIRSQIMSADLVEQQAPQQGLSWQKIAAPLIDKLLLPAFHQWIDSFTESHEEKIHYYEKTTQLQ